MKTTLLFFGLAIAALQASNVATDKAHGCHARAWGASYNAITGGGR